MIDPLTDALPQESEEQRIGRLACKSFNANVPDSWKIDPLDGDNDCGYDFQVQILDASLVKVSGIFRAQIKGQLSPSLNAAGTHFPISLALSTVNYYARATEPILLILCDVGSADQPKNYTLYYCWIQDEIRRVRGLGVAENQKTVTFHVPVANKLDGNTDLSDDLDRFRRLAHIGDDLDMLVEQQQPHLSAQDRLTLAAKVVPNLHSRSPALLTSLTDDPTTSWVEAPEGTLQWYLQETRELLRKGDVTRCQHLLDKADKLLKNAKPLEQADYWNVIGRLRIAELNDEGANEAFEHACKLSGDADNHLYPWAETLLRLRMRTGHTAVFSDAIARLTSESPRIVEMKVRLIAAEGKFNEALEIADSLSGVERHIAKSLVYTMQSKWRESLDACESGLTELATLKESERLLFLVLRARAGFSLALNLPEADGGEIVVPVNGPANTDIELIKAVWKDVSEAVVTLRRSGWPGNVEAISDVWAHVAIILGLHKEALPLMEEAAESRHALPTLQASLELLAAHSGNYQLALKANERQLESDRGILRRISLLHLTRRDNDCVCLMLSNEQIACDPRLFGYAMSLAIFSAERLIRPDVATLWIQRMEEDSELAPILAMHRYQADISANVLAKEPALDRLEADYERLGHPPVMTRQLFHELDPTRSPQAQKLIDVGIELANQQLLDLNECLLLAQAMATLGKWSELFQLSESASHRFENQDRLVAVGALALDKLGRAAEARSRLLSIVQKGNADPFALDTYINIASISGFTDEAISCIEYVLGIEDDRLRKFHYLRALLRLLQISDSSSLRLVEVAWKIGQLANQSNEIEEGVFLTSMLSVTIHENTVLPDARSKELQQRIMNFTKNFPKSKIFRSASISESPSAVEIIRVLNDFVGMDDDRVRWQSKVQNQLAKGEIPVPYVWRPRIFLNEVRDLPELWQVGKSSRWSQQQYHLAMALPGWTPIPYADIKDKVPLLDLSALLILHDLELFDKLFELFPTIAVGKATLLELQQNLSPSSGSRSRAVSEKLMAMLQARFEQIEQPGVTPPPEDSFASVRWASEEIVEIAKSDSRYIIYSDDALFRLYATHKANSASSLSTLDILNAADEKDLLNAKAVAKHIALLCSWRVQLLVQPRYQLAVLPDELRQAKTVADGVDTLQRDELCNAVFSGIWHHGKTYVELQNHAGPLIRDLAENSANSIDSATALAAFWVSKVRLHRQAPTPTDLLISLVISQSVSINQPMSPATARRIWTIFRKLVEFAYEPRMDDAIADKSLQTLAEVAMGIDRHHNLTGDRSTAERLLLGLTRGTSDYDKFRAALTIAERNKQQRG